MAVPTTSISGSALSASLTSFRTTAESSTIRTRIRRALMRLGSEGFAIYGGANHFERMAKMGEALGMADQEIAARHEPPSQAFDEFLLRRAIEIDHHVAAEDNLERLGERRLAFQQIEMVKADAVAQRRLDPIVSGLRSEAALEMRADHLQRQL